MVTLVVLMATISKIWGLTTIKIFSVAPWTRTTTTHYKHQPGTNNKQPENRTTHHTVQETTHTRQAQTDQNPK